MAYSAQQNPTSASPLQLLRFATALVSFRTIHQPTNQPYVDLGSVCDNDSHAKAWRCNPSLLTMHRFASSESSESEN